MAKKGEVKTITETTADQAEKEFQGSGVEGTKVAAETSVIRGEDVIAALRAKGHRI